MPAVAVSGAGGFIGSHAVRRFSERGWRVVGLVRTRARAALPGVEYVRHDLSGEPPSGALSGIDCLVHAAYVKGEEGLNVDGTQRLLAAARRDGVGRFVFLSSMAADSAAYSAYGRQKHQIETLFDLSRDTILRPGLVIGDGGLVRETVEFMRRWHVVPLIDGGRQPLQTIGVRDLVAVLERLVTTPVPGAYFVADPRATSYSEVYRAIARELGLRVIFVRVPYWLPLIAIRLARTLRISLGVTEDNLRGLRTARHIDTDGDLMRLGLAPEPLEVTLRRQR